MASLGALRAAGAKRSAGRLLRASAALGAAVAVLGASMTISASVAVAAPSASQLRSEAAALNVRLSAAAATVHADTAAYQQASEALSAVQSLVRGDGQRLADLERALTSTHRTLRQEAIESYTDGASPLDLAGDGVDPSPVQVSANAEYVAVAVGSVTDTLDQLAAEQQATGAARLTLEADQAASQQAFAVAQGSYQKALQAAANLQDQLDQVNNQLTQAVAAQAAAQTRAESLTTSNRPSTGLPVGNGLVGAVHTALGSPPAPASASPAGAGPAKGVSAPSSTGARGRPGTSRGSTGGSSSTGGTTPTGGSSSTGGSGHPSAGPAGGSSAGSGGAAPSGGSAGGVWLELRQCESGDNYGADTGNGYYGAYQFSEQTWLDLGYGGYPNTSPAAEQDQAAERLQAAAGWGQWPSCSAALGL